MLAVLIFLTGCSDSEDPLPNDQMEEDIIDDDPQDDKTDENSDSTLYFPPTGSNSWETVSTNSLGWNTEVIKELEDFIESSNTRALIILKDGKIAFEQYEGLTLTGNNVFSQENYWYWASAGKTLTAFMVGLAESEGLLSLDDKTSDYLGKGWTSLPEEQEEALHIWHQLTMTTGLDDNVLESDCTNPECLQFLTEPLTRWAYHNGPYTLLDGVVETATGETWDSYFNRNLQDKIGMDGFWQYNGYNHVYSSTPRSMARFGLMILASGKWGETKILDHESFFKKMISTSQDLNPSYGYLWWLNGKGNFIPPGLQIAIPTDVTPGAPDDMFAAMGKNGQLLNM